MPKLNPSDSNSSEKPSAEPIRENFLAALKEALKNFDLCRDICGILHELRGSGILDPVPVQCIWLPPAHEPLPMNCNNCGPLLGPIMTTSAIDAVKIVKFFELTIPPPKKTAHRPEYSFKKEKPSNDDYSISRVASGSLKALNASDFNAISQTAAERDAAEILGPIFRFRNKALAHFTTLAIQKHVNKGTGKNTTVLSRISVSRDASCCREIIDLTGISSPTTLLIQCHSGQVIY